MSPKWVDDTHYVIVVHGTWNAPEPDQVKWYEPGGSFSDELAKQLAGGDLEGSVWRGLGEREISFCWSGRNKHEDRLEGAKRLCDLMFRIRSEDPSARIHLVSHSHGGNVVLKAIEYYFKALSEEAEEIGRTYIEQLDAAEDLLTRHSSALDEVEESLPLAVAEHVQGEPEAFLRARRAALGLATHEVADVVLGFVRSTARGIGPWLERFGLRRFRLAGWIRDAGDRIAIPWCSYSDSHRLGRLVFLGVPFLQKRWRVHDLSTARLLSLLGGAVFGVLLAAAALHYALFAVGALIHSWTTAVPFAGWHPSEWPEWHWWLLLAIFALLSSIMLLDRLRLGPPRADANHYFDILNSSMSIDGRATALESLVISARQLDEALLALSADPFVHARVLPLLDELTRPKPPQRPRRRGGRGAGVSKLASSEFFREIARLPLLPLQILARGVATTGLFLLRPVLVPLLGSAFQRVASAAGSGLPTHEMSMAFVQVTEGICESRIFRPEWAWDVSRRLSGIAITRPGASDAGSRFEFLWDDEALATRAARSDTWSGLEDRVPDILGRFAAEERPEELRRLMRVCLMLEERVRELGGAVELAHSQYYGDPEVVAAVARFLESGETPAGVVQRA